MMGDYEITPFRMNQLMRAAAKMVDQMSSTLHVTYPEMKIMLQTIECMVAGSMAVNQEMQEKEE